MLEKEQEEYYSYYPAEAEQNPKILNGNDHSF